MRAVVVYESMFGATHRVAEAIGRGLSDAAQVEVVAVAEATPEVIAQADLLVVGGPTHVHSMSRRRTRDAAVAMAAKPDSLFHLDAHAKGPGVREWLSGLPSGDSLAAAFDTRAKGVAFLTGRASKTISRRLRRHGRAVIARPKSFVVTGRDSHLDTGEEERAEAWGRKLADIGHTLRPGVLVSGAD